MLQNDAKVCTGRKNTCAYNLVVSIQFFQMEEKNGKVTSISTHMI